MRAGEEMTQTNHRLRRRDMRAIPKTLGALALVAILAAAPASAEPVSVIKGNHVMVAYGAEQGPHARITFSKDRAARDGLAFETFAAGGTGSTLTLYVDQDSAPIFTHTFAAAECTGEPKSQHCTIQIARKDAMPGTLRNRFSHGRISRIKIETGGAVEMSQEVELNGFGRAVRGTRR